MELKTIEFSQPLLLFQDLFALSRDSICCKAPNGPTRAGARMLPVSRFYPLEGVENEGSVSRRVDGILHLLECGFAPTDEIVAKLTKTTLPWPELFRRLNRVFYVDIEITRWPKLVSHPNQFAFDGFCLAVVD